MSVDTIVFYRDNSNEWRWRVIAANHEIIGASTEGYRNQADAKRNLSMLVPFCLEGDIRIAAESGGEDRAIMFYEDNGGEWRWRVTASNGKIIHASSEGFTTKQSAVQNLRLLVKVMQTTETAS